MIRRPESTPAGPRWLLIPQPEHARLAGVLAEQWNDLAIADPPTREQLLATIHRHDDGWRDWEETPAVDMATGRPLDFTEMPMADALAIWTKSIDGVKTLGPLAPWLASGHFCDLLRHSIQRGNQNETDARLAAEFLHVQQAHQADWLAAWRRLEVFRNTASVAEACLQILQSFDWLSLWMCCRDRTEPLTFKTSDVADAVTIRPHSTRRFTVAPWPFRAASLRVEVTAWSLPADSYPNADVIARQRTPAQISWHLERTVGRGQ